MKEMTEEKKVKEKKMLLGLEWVMIALIALCIAMAIIEEVNFALPYLKEYISTGSIIIE